MKALIGLLFIILLASCTERYTVSTTVKRTVIQTTIWDMTEPLAIWRDTVFNCTLPTLTERIKLNRARADSLARELNRINRYDNIQH